MKMSKEELFQYVHDEDESLKATDWIDMKFFDQGIKIFYFHKDSEKPFKTKVYLNPALVDQPE